MSRSAWKPAFVSPDLASSFQKNGLSVSHICFQRSSILLSPRVGARLLVWNGNRFYPLTVSDERVGHRAGEFAPTRKRPPLTAKAAAKKAQKLRINLYGTKNTSCRSSSWTPPQVVFFLAYFWSFHNRIKVLFRGLNAWWRNS